MGLIQVDTFACSSSIVYYTCCLVYWNQNFKGMPVEAVDGGFSAKIDLKSRSSAFHHLCRFLSFQYSEKKKKKRHEGTPFCSFFFCLESLLFPGEPPNVKTLALFAQRRGAEPKVQVILSVSQDRNNGEDKVFILYNQGRFLHVHCFIYLEVLRTFRWFQELLRFLTRSRFGPNFTKWQFTSGFKRFKTILIQ